MGAAATVGAAVAIGGAGGGVRADERRLAEQEWTWATEISSSPFSPICRPLAPVLSSLALHFAAGRPVRPEPRPVWLVRLEPARFVQVEAQPR